MQALRPPKFGGIFRVLREIPFSGNTMRMKVITMNARTVLDSSRRLLVGAVPVAMAMASAGAGTADATNPQVLP
ncbi:hypothetical protein GCM10027089_48950 [Nocardia thraciensis]